MCVSFCCCVFAFLPACHFLWFLIFRPRLWSQTIWYLFIYLFQSKNQLWNISASSCEPSGGGGAQSSSVEMMEMLAFDTQHTLVPHNHLEMSWRDPAVLVLWFDCVNVLCNLCWAVMASHFRWLLHPPTLCAGIDSMVTFRSLVTLLHNFRWNQPLFLSSNLHADMKTALPHFDRLMKQKPFPLTSGHFTDDGRTLTGLEHAGTFEHFSSSLVGGLECDWREIQPFRAKNAWVFPQNPSKTLPTNPPHGRALMSPPPWLNVRTV